MVPGIADALNPFQQDFSDAEDFINILRQANAPFTTFDQLFEELLPLQQLADSWVQLALHSFGSAGALPTTTVPQDMNSLLAGAALSNGSDSPAPAPGLQDIGGLLVGSPLPGVPTPGVPDAGALVGAPLPAAPALSMQDMGGFFSGAPVSDVPSLIPQADHVLLVGEPIPPAA